MVRPFSLRDSFLIHRLQKRGLRLAVDQALVQERSPLWTALTAPIPWHVNGVATYVLRARVRDQQLGGFVQVQRRWDRPEADLVFLAPDLGAAEAPEIWRRLLRYCCQQAGENGIQRLYVSLPDRAEELQLFRNASFSLYVREDFFRLKLPTSSEAAAEEDIRASEEVDDWQLRRLYTRCTPRPVQLAEGGLGTEQRPPFLAEVEGVQVRNFALLEGAQEVGGLIQVMSGRDGHLLRIWGDAMDPLRMERLLSWGIARAGQPPRRPVYCVVRDYQGGLRAILEELGFEYIGRRARLVKHLVRAERVPVTNATPALDLRTDAITTVSGLDACVGEEATEPVPVRADEQPAAVVMAELP